MPHRSATEQPQDVWTDKPEGLRVKYEVPLTWLLGVLGIILAQAATLYFGQQRQGDAILALSASNRDLVEQIKVLSSQVASKDLKDLQHDMEITALTRRMDKIEVQHSPKGRP